MTEQQRSVWAKLTEVPGMFNVPQGRHGDTDLAGTLSMFNVLQGWHCNVDLQLPDSSSQNHCR